MAAKGKKILLIRMLGLGDVTCVGIPALRYFKQAHPDAQIDFLTFSAGKEVIELAEPGTRILCLGKQDWPDNIFLALEAFLGLAEQIIPEKYDLIVNLDTWFMPCFLARFLKDAGEPVRGNTISISVQQLIDGLQQQTLSPDYVNTTESYLQSTWFSMALWHTAWWQGDYLPENGYPEYYLKKCCGFDNIQMDMHIDVAPDPALTDKRAKTKVIALATDARTAERHYPFGADLKHLLVKRGYHVWTGFDGSTSMAQTLAQLKASDLLITVPSAPQWLATTVGCPSLVISGQVDPRTLMPEYAIDPSPAPIPAFELADSVDSIFTGTGSQTGV